jgi:hypothetical protein
MVTLTNALEIANKKGLSFDCYSTCFNRWGEYEPGRSYFGFTLGKGVWYWFWIFDDGYMIFDHAYSQNNGKTYKGSTHRNTAYKNIE